MAYQFGDVVLVPFPFTDQSTKQRPAIVVSSTAYNRIWRDVILMAVTGQVRGGGTFGEIVIEDWQAAKLLKRTILSKSDWALRGDRQFDSWRSRGNAGAARLLP